MADLSRNARKFLAVLQAEAADAPVQPKLGLGPMSALTAEAELIRAEMIERHDDGTYRLLPAGIRA